MDWRARAQRGPWRELTRAARSGALLCALVSLVAGCPTTSGEEDGLDGGERDADAGAPATDAGAPDASVPQDAGAEDVPPPPEPDAGPLYPDYDAGPPTDAGGAFWDGVGEGLYDQPLVQALQARLEEAHVALAYSALIPAYLETDFGRGGCPGIFDFYSSTCWSGSSSCGNYDEEGDCYNREHSWPKSWWGGSENIDPYTDLIAVIPADGYVNNLRGNLPLGEVASPSYVSRNGSRIGACANVEAMGNCFEPPDELKGDLARIYFYMAVRYEGALGCCDVAAVTGADLDPWAEQLLRGWHALDPVDEEERARNDAVAELQGSRNPFVDYPAWLSRIADF